MPEKVEFFLWKLSMTECGEINRSARDGVGFGWTGELVASEQCTL